MQLSGENVQPQPMTGGMNLSGFGYEVVSHVGRGHSASARVVRELETGHLFVAKCVSLAALNEHDQDYANQEAGLLQSLRHPFVVAYHDSFLVDGANVLVIVMEYCEGGDLRKLISEMAQSGRHFAEDQVMTWFVQIALALRYIHSEKVLHRDLKTSNIFLNDNLSTVKLGDFGISRVLEQTLDAAVTMVGTPYYMSPEVCSNSPYSWKSDIWALGCVLYEMCMLKHAFESSSLLGLVYKICSDHYEPIPSFYSAELNDLVRRLLSKKESSRPAIDELLEIPYVKSYLEKAEALLGPLIADGLNVPLPKGHRPSICREALPDQFVHSLSTVQAGSSLPTLGFYQLDPHSRAVIIASRVRRQLVKGKVNWIAALAPFDETSEGVLSQPKMQAALASLHLGLSDEEAVFLVESLAQGHEAKVSLLTFEAQLVEAVNSPEVQQLEAWAEQLLHCLGACVSEALHAGDQEGLGMLNPEAFRAVMQDVAPEMSPKQIDLLELLAGKDRLGSVDYMDFVDTFGARRPRPPKRDAFMEFADAFGDPPEFQGPPCLGGIPPPPCVGGLPPPAPCIGGFPPAPPLDGGTAHSFQSCSEMG
mmetsp:Transcript_107317/g.285541  ORF Transcript_107317/g.285541 Transcript_107317/m.285541 type:complete len:591 (-) Transcript_107317:167-1939(-)